jgi:Flp pilus assembly protein TadD
MVGLGVFGGLVAIAAGVLVAQGALGRSSANDPMPHVYLSRRARDANDLVTAKAEAMKAVELGPTNAAALRELAATLFVQQNYAGARTFYTRAVKADPEDRLSQGFLGCSLIRLGRVEEGMRWMQRAGSGAWSRCAPAPGSLRATSP